MWSKEVASAMKDLNLEMFTVRGNSPYRANRDGAAVRIRRKNTMWPVLDCFFVKELEDGRWAKVNSWCSDRVVTESRETWERDWLFPIRHVRVGPYSFPIGSNPDAMLKRQYGNDTSDVAIVHRACVSGHATSRGLLVVFEFKKTVKDRDAQQALAQLIAATCTPASQWSRF
jgi:hypothetical protein